MIKFRISLVILSILFSGFLNAQDGKSDGLKAITDEAVEAQLEFLSSDWTEGRSTGSRGAYLSADYIASMFKVYGLKAGGDMQRTRVSRRERMQGKESKEYRSYFQNFPLIEYKSGKEQSVSLITRSKNSESIVNFISGVDFSVNTGSISTGGKSEIVFVGYGYSDKKNKFNDFEKADVKNKIIIRLASYPGHKDTSSLAYQKFYPKDRRSIYYMRREKNNNAVDQGVIAILEVNTGSDHSYKPSNVPFRYNSPLYEGNKRQNSYYDTRMALPGDSLNQSPPVFYISMRMANEILSESGISIKEFENEMAKNPVSQTKSLKNKEIQFKTSVEAKIIQARNVIGILEGKSTDEIIVVGGHYDHLGMHDGYIWNGADDNASGTVGVMTIAKACMATGEEPEKTIVFAAWTGEEKGLLGSKYFVENPFDSKKILLNLNYDMISRDDEVDTLGNQCRMSFPTEYPKLENFTIENIKKYNLDLDINYRPSSSARGGSDHAPFAAKDIPYFYFMAGFPPEYHQSDDHIDLVNIKKMSNIIRIGYLNIWDFANTDSWQD